ncbi:glycoside hydrolase family 92 protein [Mycena floridula]|nr:glycoside hydrolase family 92 protein [Mycena floridula]
MAFWLYLLLFGLPVSASNIDKVNPLIGNGGDTPNGSGGMIPSTSPPFGMTRWVAQTHENYVSRTPYNYSDSSQIHGFQGTHQPAIWMGESGQVVVVPGMGPIKREFSQRGLKKGREQFGVGHYRVELLEGVQVDMTATSHVAHLSFSFTRNPSSESPYILVESSRPSTVFSVSNADGSSGTYTVYPLGYTEISPRHICGWNSEQQDTIIHPTSINGSAQHFKGYFCAEFDTDFLSSGIAQGSDDDQDGAVRGEGTELAAYARFEWPAGKDTLTVTVKVGTSFISMEQALENIALEIPDHISIEETIRDVESRWSEKLDRFTLDCGKAEECEEMKTVFLTGIFHALQYPYEQFESSAPKYYSGYDNKVHSGESYTGYSIWDTYRAEWALLILLAPERIPGMIQSMLQDYEQGGWLPMWKNIVETNIMVGTHADSLIAEAVIKGFAQSFDIDLAWEAVWKDATVPPVQDDATLYYDREEGVDYEVRAGLTSVYGQQDKGWVADDVHSESASRTLDYACYDDFAAAQLALALNKSQDTVSFLLNRAMTTPWTLWNPDATDSGTRGFIEARNASGEWAGPTKGFTEGDKHAYSFAIPHDIPTLIEKRGGNESFVKSLDTHFDGGFNDHTNEPSHHIPYLYALAGAPAKTQERVRTIAREDYNSTDRGLSGNEDCGQMSAWYIFSAMGFYPVNPVSGDFVVGSPFFDEMSIVLPVQPFTVVDSQSPYYVKGKGYKLTIQAPGASSGKIYVKSLTVNGKAIEDPIIRHSDMAQGGTIVFEMSDQVEEWAGGYGVWTKVENETLNWEEKLRVEL